MPQAYVIEGSEDGVIAVFTNATKAVAKAAEVYGEPTSAWRYDPEDTEENEDGTHTSRSGACLKSMGRALRNGGVVTFYVGGAQVTVTAWEISQ